MFIIKLSKSFSLFLQHFPETTYISSIKDVTRRFSVESGESSLVIYLHILHPFFLREGKNKICLGVF